MSKSSLIPAKYLRFIAYFAIVACSISIALVLAAFFVSGDKQKLYPLVLPSTTILLAVLQLRLMKKNDIGND